MLEKDSWEIRRLMSEEEPEYAISVYNLQAKLVRKKDNKDGSFGYLPTEKQPPEKWLLDVVYEQGGARNISGIYPIENPEFLEKLQKGGYIE